MNFEQQYDSLSAPICQAIRACKSDIVAVIGSDQEGLQVGSIVAFIGIEILREILTDKGAALWLYSQADKLAAKPPQP